MNTSSWFQGLSRQDRKELLTLLHDVRRILCVGGQDSPFWQLLLRLEEEHLALSTPPPPPESEDGGWAWHDALESWSTIRCH